MRPQLPFCDGPFGRRRTPGAVPTRPYAAL
jgi:hypothetical protein